MKPFRRLGEATAPDGTILALFEHDGAYVIRVNGIELMSTRRHNSEDALAELVCAPLADKRNARVLVGGLGLGFTLKTALRLLAPDATVMVAEIVQAVIDWNRNVDYPLAHEALADARVEMRHDDVARVLRQNPAAFDAIMLDVDNGAESFTTGSNKKLYGEKGIRQAAAALKPGGTLAYWSVDTENAFVRALKREGLTTAVHKVRSHASSGGYNCVILARRPSVL